MSLNSNFFKQEEFKCKCGTCTPLFIPEQPDNSVEMPKPRWVPYSLLKRLDILRSTVGEPLHVTSGYRCPKYNARVNGAKNSYHMKGLAADLLYPKKMSKDKFKDYCKKIFHDGGVGTYNTFVHVDVRGKKARW